MRDVLLEDAVEERAEEVDGDEHGVDVEEGGEEEERPQPAQAVARRSDPIELSSERLPAR